MSQADDEPIASAAELLDVVRLTDVHFEEVAAKRRPERDPDVDQEPELQLMLRHEERLLALRVVLDAESPDATYHVDGVAEFRSDEPFTCTEEAAREFVERVALMALYPFLREAVVSLSGRLGVGRTLLGLLSAGRVHIEPDEPLSD